MRGTNRGEDMHRRTTEDENKTKKKIPEKPGIDRTEQNRTERG